MADLTTVPTSLPLAPDGSPVGSPVVNNVPGGSRGTTLTEHYAKPSAYAWLLAWGVLLALLALINRTRLGHAAIYYGLLLMLFFVILSNYRFIATALEPFNTLPNQ